MRRRCSGAASALALATVVLAGPAAAQPCPPTRPDALGPFYEANAPERTSTGRGFMVTGVVRSSASCRPLSGAALEWWSAGAGGDYDDAHRATVRADAEGRFRYETDFPGRYPGRPPHVHVRVTAPGHRPLVTQLYPRAGQRAIESDFVLVSE